MKTFLVLLSLSSLTLAASSVPEKKPLSAQPVAKKVPSEKAAKILDTKEEDCDDKAKKPIEIKPETISLGGNTGCSLDEAKP